MVTLFYLCAASTTRATTRDVSTSQSITTLLVTETPSTQASSSLASATSISPKTTTVQLATSTGTLVTNGSTSTSSAPANVSFGEYDQCTIVTQIKVGRAEKNNTVYSF